MEIGAAIRVGRDSLADPDAKDRAAAEMREYDEDIANAERQGRAGEAGQLRAERDHLAAKRAAAFGLGGRDRLLGSSPDEQTFDRVQKAIGRAIRDIKDRGLVRCAEHLTKTIMRAKAQSPFQYRPDATTPAWDVSGHI